MLCRGNSYSWLCVNILKYKYRASFIFIAKMAKNPENSVSLCMSALRNKHARVNIFVHKHSFEYAVWRLNMSSGPTYDFINKTIVCRQ